MQFIDKDVQEVYANVQFWPGYDHRLSALESQIVDLKKAYFRKRD
jgi:hypothetical protein